MLICNCESMIFFCYEFVSTLVDIAITDTVTAGGKGYLRTLSLAKLKNYMQSYGIRLGPDVLEKEDVIDAIINARVSLCISLTVSRTQSII